MLLKGENPIHNSALRDELHFMDYVCTHVYISTYIYVCTYAYIYIHTYYIA